MPAALVQAGGAVQTRIRAAVVHLHFTVCPTVADRAGAPKTLLGVGALAVHAGLLRAGHSLGLAVPPDPSLVALAAKGRGSVAVVNVNARGPIDARLLLAVRDQDLAVGAHESGLAVASVGALSGVEADALVLARLVIRAVVQVLVAEQTAPSLVALALPGLLAGSVHASRVRLAFGAQRSLPAVIAAVEVEEENTQLVDDHLITEGIVILGPNCEPPKPRGCKK